MSNPVQIVARRRRRRHEDVNDNRHNAWEGVMSDAALTGYSKGVVTNDVRKVALASLIGSTIEWYDFFLYGVVAGIVFNELYFPSDDATISILLAYATFAVGFVARPLGGLIFGHYGDRIGRKT